MIIKFWLYVLLFGLLVVFFGCETSVEGTFRANQPPTTNLTINEINRSGEDRLSSQINISWWGDDPDGFITGFEIAINDTGNASNWIFTNRNDSTFVLPIPSGEDTADVVFFVRSIDNEDLRDPDPASLIFPIKNSQPEVKFKRNPLPPERRQIPPDSTFNIASFGWSLNDEDGIANIAFTEIALNRPDGEWVRIPVEETFISIKAQNSSGGLTNADLFFGSNFRNSGETLTHLQVGAKNTFYVRAIDQAGAVSEVDTVSWFVKEKRSEILLLHDEASSNSDAAVQFHLSTLNQLGFEVDIWDISVGTAERGQTLNLSGSFPAIINPTLTKTLAEWDHIYWLSNSLNRNINSAQEITTEFFSTGGTMFVTIPMTDLPEDSPLLNFLAIQEQAQLPSLGTGFVIANNTEVRPTENLENAPSMVTSRIITGLTPFRPIPGAQAMYETDFFVALITGRVQPFEEFGNISVKNSEGNLIYFGMDLQTINGNNNMQALLERLLIGELGFSDGRN